MRHRHSGCGPRGRFEIDIPEALVRDARRAGCGRLGTVPFRFRRRWPRAAAAAAGRGRRRMFESGELRLVLLKLIADEPRHGYDLIRAIEELTGGEYAPSPGVIYPTLTLLQDMGLIEEAEGEGPAQAVPGDRRGPRSISRRRRTRSRPCSSGWRTIRAARAQLRRPGDRPGDRAI